MPSRTTALYLGLLACLPFWVSLTGAFPGFSLLYLTAVSLAVLFFAATGRLRLTPAPVAAALILWVLFECFRSDVWDRSAEIGLVWFVALGLGVLARFLSSADAAFPARTAILIWCTASFIAALNPTFRASDEAIEEALEGAAVEESYKQAVIHSALQDRFHFPFGNPIHLGLFLALSLLSLPFLHRLTEGQARPLLWRAALLTTGFAQIFILWGTRARTSILALVAGAVVVLFLWRRPKGRTLAIGAVGGLVLAAGLLATPAGREMASRVETVKARAIYWGAALSMIQEEPLIGLGVGGFGNHYPRHRPLTPHQTEFAHQVFLEAAVDWGGVGFFLFVATFLVLGRRFLVEVRSRLKSEAPGVRSAVIWQCSVLTAFLAACQVDFPNNQMYLLWAATVVGSLRIGGGAPSIARNKIGPAGAAAICLFLGVACVLGCRELGSARFEKARAALENDRDGRVAYALLTRAVAVWPPLWEAHYFQGRMAADAGNLELGLAGIEKAIRWSPTTAFLHEDRARLLWRQGRHEEALEAIRVAIGRHPVKHQYHRTLAGWLHELGRSSEAAKERDLAEKLKAIEPDYAAEVKRIREERRDR